MNWEPGFYRTKDGENELTPQILLDIHLKECWPKVFHPCVGEGVGGASSFSAGTIISAL